MDQNSQFLLRELTSQMANGFLDMHKYVEVIQKLGIGAGQLSAHHESSSALTTPSPLRDSRPSSVQPPMSTSLSNGEPFSMPLSLPAIRNPSNSLDAPFPVPTPGPNSVEQLTSGAFSSPFVLPSTRLSHIEQEPLRLATVHPRAAITPLDTTNYFASLEASMGHPSSLSSLNERPTDTCLRTVVASYEREPICPPAT